MISARNYNNSPITLNQILTTVAPPFTYLSKLGQRKIAEATQKK